MEEMEAIELHAGKSDKLELDLPIPNGVTSHWLGNRLRVCNVASAFVP